MSPQRGSNNDGHHQQEDEPATVPTSTDASTGDDARVVAQEDENNRGRQLSLEEVMYSAASYHAIVKPVTLTMILSSLAVVYINTEESRQQGQQQLTSTYTVFDTTSSSSDSNSELFGLSLINALVIVAAICAMTFVIVLLYKYRCMKVLMVYMVVASATLLGFLGGRMFEVAIDKYELSIDKISFYLTMWNFAMVGTVAIFFSLGVPVYVTQGYLIATSVILAWQLAHFDAWTSWTLLVMLALYDLCAVLTPCGPLKWLVKLMTKEGSPGIMPGLLYEAQLPANARRPGQRDNNTNDNNNSNPEERQQEERNTANSSNSRTSEEEQSEQTTQRQTRRRRNQLRRRNTEVTIEESSVATTVRSDSVVSTGSPSEQRSSILQRGPSTVVVLESSSNEEPTDNSNSSAAVPSVDEYGFPLPQEESSAAVPNESAVQPPLDNDTPDSSSPPPPPPTGIIPLAIAKLYKLRLVDPIEPAHDPPPLSEQEEQTATPNVILSRLYTPDQLKSTVEAVFPRNGGRIDVEFPTSGSSRANRNTNTRYIVRDRHGIVKRRLLVDDEGKVYEEQSRREGHDDDDSGDNTIKLGLGDFIFYSILVATAALYSFTTFAACTLVVLAGLGFTLVLLAVYHRALPALPISIALGVVFYLLTRASIEPWIEDIFRTAYYV